MPRAGETLPLGPLGGHSVLSFQDLAAAALAFAPAGASRETVLEGIGRGIGRAAAHELAHAILGASPTMDTLDDENSYEHASFSRRSQYYGELRWTTAWPLLLRKIGG